ncbi:hypothetical protein [Flavihumibacter fluvii]|uniref:hypothetical protein n=1 Tax=Flavihumibacter fluvii TaxID=2838157 RepID=UPI001BDF581F|nr:hypothetical protein [Flavihumibacter fluvii]ULQ53608.1 hypothetical protein KJS93_04645 [Flavihumibacter fluvii]
MQALTVKQKTLLTYLAFLFFSGIGIIYGNSLGDQVPNLRVWTSANLFWLLLGIPFAMVQPEAKLPEFWQPEVFNKSRLWKPIAVGILFGLLDIIVVKVIMHPEPYTELPPFLQPFPYSIFLYFSGAFEIEVFYRLIPMTLLLLIGAKYKNGRYWLQFFWVGAILTSLREPLEQFPRGSVLFIMYSLASGFLMNLLQAMYFRNAGFLAAIALRIGHYLLWHILLGMYVQFIEIK